MIANVPALVPGNLRIGTTYNKYGVYVRALRQCLIDVGLEWNDTAATHTLVGGDDGLAVGVQNAILDRFWRKSTKYD